MRLKSFLAPTVAEAMKLVRQSLGDEAIIIATQSDVEGGVRVTAALDSPALETKAPPRRPAAARPGGEKIAGRRPASYMEQLRAADPLPPIRLALNHHGFSGELVDRIVAVARDAAVRNFGEGTVRILAAAMAGIYNHAGIRVSRGKPIMLVGPPGAGKTVTAAKLAWGTVNAGRAARVITTDTLKTGGIEQLKGLTEAMKLGLREARDPGELAAALAACAGGDLVVIDSCGTNPFDDDDMGQLALFLAAAYVEPMLVLPAGMDAVDARETARAFAEIGCRRMIVTRCDIARRLGSMFSAASATDMSFVKFSRSPKIADGLEPASMPRLAQLLLQSQDIPAATDLVKTEPVKTKPVKKAS